MTNGIKDPSPPDPSKRPRKQRTSGPVDDPQAGSFDPDAGVSDHTDDDASDMNASTTTTDQVDTTNDQAIADVESGSDKQAGDTGDKAPQTGRPLAHTKFRRRRR